MDVPFPQNYNDKLSFIAEHCDSYKINFILNYYPVDKTISLFDKDLNRTFLKRSLCTNLKENDIFVGNTVNIYGRRILITDYADARTRNYVGKSKDSTLTIIKPGVINYLGAVLTDIESRNFKIVRLKMLTFNRKTALDFLSDQKGDAFLPFIVEHLVSGNCVAVQLVGENAIERWQNVLGPLDPVEARKKDPNSLIAIYGNDKAANGFHASRNDQAAIRETQIIFPETIERNHLRSVPLYENTTCCVIKSHAISEGKLGPIIKAINESQFYITAMQMFYLNKANTEEFLEVYKGVISDFYALAASFLYGPCVAMEIASKNADINVHEEFRKFAGPSRPDIARQIRSHTLRAKFGVDDYKNAVHCTDLPEDTVLELEYFFKLLT